MKMNDYIVKLRIQTCGFEKNTTKIVYATNEENARRDALISECHGDIDDGTAEWDGDTINDMCGEFIYSVLSVIKVDDKDLLLIRKYLN